MLGIMVPMITTIPKVSANILSFVSSFPLRYSSLNISGIAVLRNRMVSIIRVSPWALPRKCCSSLCTRILVSMPFAASVASFGGLGVLYSPRSGSLRHGSRRATGAWAPLTHPEPTG